LISDIVIERNELYASGDTSHSLVFVSANQFPRPGPGGDTVVVHEHDDLALSLTNPAISGGGRTLVGLRKISEERMLFSKTLENLQRPVVRAIIYDDDLELIFRVVLSEERSKSSLDETAAVVSRNDYGN